MHPFLYFIFSGINTKCLLVPFYFAFSQNCINFAIMINLRVL